jgi:hypothetical protein
MIDPEFKGFIDRAIIPVMVERFLRERAERQRAAIAMVRHLTKGSRDKSIYRGQGNVDITAACRSCLLAGIDPTDATKERKVLIHIKSNLARLGPSLSFSIEKGCFT